MSDIKRAKELLKRYSSARIPFIVINTMERDRTLEILKEVAEYGANILTIHQSIPLNGVATLTLSVEILSTTGNLSDMVAEIEENQGVHYLKIVGRE